MLLPISQRVESFKQTRRIFRKYSWKNGPTYKYYTQYSLHAFTNHVHSSNITHSQPTQCYFHLFQSIRGMTHSIHQVSQQADFSTSKEPCGIAIKHLIRKTQARFCTVVILQCPYRMERVYAGALTLLSVYNKQIMQQYVRSTLTSNLQMVREHPGLNTCSDPWIQSSECDTITGSYSIWGVPQSYITRNTLKYKGCLHSVDWNGGME